MWLLAFLLGGSLVDLRDYLHVARKRWPFVLASVAVAIAVAAILTVRTPPQYATSVTFFITTPNTGVTDAYQGGLFSQQRVKSYANLLAGDRLATAVAAQNRVGLNASEVRGRITAAPVPETVLLRATITDRYPDRSMLIAQELARQFKTLVEQLETPPGGMLSAVKVEVIAGPELNTAPVSPRPARNISLAILIGLAIGFGVAVLREALDTTIKTSESLRETVSAPVLATVPFDAAAKDDPLLVGATARSARAESIRQLRTNLQFVDVDHPVKTLVVTSAIPGEGKSSTACNLAILFAESGKRVVLIDADLRRPRLAEYLNLESSAGLTTVLAGQARVSDVLQRWGDQLWVLSSGLLPPNPSELLGSKHMAELLNELREEFDIVIVDCPPLLPVTDGAVVAAHADGALLLVRCQKTTTAQAASAAQALRSVDARLLGCVFNMAAIRKSNGYYTYYGYGSYSADDARATADRTPAPDFAVIGDLLADDNASRPPADHDGDVEDGAKSAVSATTSPPRHTTDQRV